jgi:uncharacterized protein YfaS (alpha-2-macroglobulin family)
MWMKTLADKSKPNHSFAISNIGKSTLFVRLISEGIPAQGKEKAYANGITVGVKYTSIKGAPINVNTLKQGTNFVASVTVKNQGSSGYNYIVLTQVFPSGWEILNTRYMNENVVKQSDIQRR